MFHHVIPVSPGDRILLSDAKNIVLRVQKYKKSAK